MSMGCPSASLCGLGIASPFVGGEQAYPPFESYLRETAASPLAPPVLFLHSAVGVFVENFRVFFVSC